MLNLEIASILPFHWGFSHELHENPSFASIPFHFASIPFHEECVGLVDVVRLLDEHDKFLFVTRSFQLLNTSSIVIGLEFMFSNLFLTISENLLLSFQKNPNLLIFRVVSLGFLGARHKCANKGSPRSIMTDWRRQTGRQAFFWKIGSSSARIKERLADGDVIVVEVIREPLFARGLLKREARTRPRCQGPQRKYAGYLSTTSWEVEGVGSDSTNSRVIREVMRKEMKWMEKSKRSEATLTARMNHEDDHGMNGDSNWSQTVCVHVNKENSQGTMTLTDNKEERLRNRGILNAWWLMHWHLQRSKIFQVFQLTSHIVGIFALHFVSPIQLLTLNQIYSTSDQSENSCRDSHCENGLVKCCLYDDTHPLAIFDHCSCFISSVSGVKVW